MRSGRRRRYRATWCAAWLCIGGTLLPGTTAAQGVPGSVDPGRVPQRLQPPPAPRSSPDIAVPDIPGAVPPAAAEQIRFRLTRLVVEGSTVYSEEQLAPLYADAVGKVVSLAVIYRIADSITAKYRSDGYVLSRAVVPAQRIDEGVVHIRVVEGFVDGVVIQGKDNPTIRAYAEAIRRSRPLTAVDLERYLLLINDLPGLRARGVLTPAPGVLGGSDLTIITTYKAADFTLDTDNRGSEFVGSLQAFAGAALNDLSDRSDRVEGRFVTTPMEPEELRYGDLAYTIPVGADGLKLSLFVNANESLPGSTLNSDLIKTEASGTSATLRLSYPVLRSRSENLIVDGSFGLRQAIVDQYALPSHTKLISSYEDRIRAVRAGASYDIVDPWGGTNFLRVEVSRGLPILDASEDGAMTGASRPGGRTEFTKLTVDAFRLQDLGAVAGGLQLLVAASGGWAVGDQLLASEQFGVGGAPYGRGYDPSELTGDYGAAGKVELQYRFRVDPDPRWPELQAYGFYDVGVVTSEDPQALNQTDGTRTLASAGFGLRSRLTDWASANLEIAKPLTRGVAADADSSDPKAARLYFGLSARF